MCKSSVLFQGCLFYFNNDNQSLITILHCEIVFEVNVNKITVNLHEFVFSMLGVEHVQVTFCHLNHKDITFFLLQSKRHVKYVFLFFVLNKAKCLVESLWKYVIFMLVPDN